MVELQCHHSHNFDLECVGPWLQLKGTCAICRTDFTKYNPRREGTSDKIKKIQDQEASPYKWRRKITIQTCYTAELGRASVLGSIHTVTDEQQRSGVWSGTGFETFIPSRDKHALLHNSGYQNTD